MRYEAVIGLETHVELLTDSKMFCGCAVSFGEDPNTNTCPVCLALPGALPVPNEKAIEGILQIGLALNCEIAPVSFFHRKNYFYPDLPKNYQISQYDVPICGPGRIEVSADDGPAVIGITRVHMEEDTGKSIHVGDGDNRIHGASHSLLDFNRAGVPLVEIVTEPDLRTPDQARAYAQELQRIIRTLGVSDAKLEEGRMRFDANVSIRPEGSEVLGTRAEVKNVNSIRSLQRAIAFEIERQIELVESGGTVVQETRHWNESIGATRSMRTKEDSEDYRYFQEPDLVPLEVTAEALAVIRQGLPELPAAKRVRLEEAGLDAATAAHIASDDGMIAVFEGALAAGGDPASVARWLSQDVAAYLRREDVEVAATPLAGTHLAELSAMVADGKLSSTAAKEVLSGVLAGEGSPSEVAGERDLIQISDSTALEAHVDAVLAEHPDVLDKLRSGDMKPIGVIVGQVMKVTGGKADPRMVSEIVRSRATG